MADILLTCPDCGKQTPISEYAAENTVACHDCGKSLPIPERIKSSGGGLKLRKDAHLSTDTPIPTWQATGTGSGIPAATMRQPSASLARDIRRVKLNRILQSLSWLMFIVLAAALVFIRFRHGLPFVPLDTIKQYGLIAIGISYLVIIILALKDNMFDGLLAIVVPLYPFYYLFCISNAVFMRAIVAALLLAFGFDFVLLVQMIWLQVYNKVTYWIQNV
ncbi:MAG: hypothetical protein KKG09_04915 [Verrucomicrobia bacterium]|nr:hypothetical protein [Verrucomicrobiota bacterium]MCG2680258.1 hypothetical protein [Kiritimatiellia bacterium]MBU4248540.1 hypothetical protein [Verrucomicrobiota bacterium]MBU4289777.1 hypothetical protein [Verrucomicrobiota bacterium]MBU4429585.1 hypothetical protein [Verrucomicrobiota bacterium]